MNIKKYINELYEYIDDEFEEEESQETDFDEIRRDIQQNVQDTVEYVCEYGDYEKMKIIVGDIASILDIEDLKDVEKYIADIRRRIVG